MAPTRCSRTCGRSTTSTVNRSIASWPEPSQNPPPSGPQPQRHWDGFVHEASFCFSTITASIMPGRSPRRWRAFAYYPFVGTFFPTNGRPTTSSIALDPALREDDCGLRRRRLHEQARRRRSPRPGRRCPDRSPSTKRRSASTSFSTGGSARHQGTFAAALKAKATRACTSWDGRRAAEGEADPDRTGPLPAATPSPSTKPVPRRRPAGEAARAPR